MHIPFLDGKHGKVFLIFLIPPLFLELRYLQLKKVFVCSCRGAWVERR